MASTKTVHFTPELFKFLRALKRNNDRDWFKANRDRYIEQVRDPMLQFIEDFAPRLRKISRHLVADASPVGGSMFRIHRDTRFAKDKSPYKLAATAQFRHALGKDVHTPGFYVHLGLDGVFAASGIWRPDRDAVAAIRDAIVADPAKWKRTVRSTGFRNGTLRLAGDRLKRPPRGYEPTHPLVEDLKYKDFTTVTDLDEKAACAPGFVDRYTEICRAATPFMRFLTTALDVEW